MFEYYSTQPTSLSKLRLRREVLSSLVLLVVEIYVTQEEEDGNCSCMLKIFNI